MNRLWNLYHGEIPDFLREFAATPPMERLKDVGMNCGCEYTQFPRFVNIGPYSRFDHSLGVALIVWHFTGDMAQALAGMFHDVTTPVFAHVVDFLNGDHLRQESTEAGVEGCLFASKEVMDLLGRYGICLEQVTDYHRYPIADNDSPALSADRLEYTLGNLLNYGFADMETIRRFYGDLVVGKNERWVPELIFRTPEIATAFASAALRNAYVYVADEDRFAMESLARLLRMALERGVLIRDDLHMTEPYVVSKLESDNTCHVLWRRFCGYSRILFQDTEPAGEGWLRIDAKKRWIDPLAAGKGRVSRWDAAVAQEMAAFCGQDFSYWLRGE